MTNYQNFANAVASVIPHAGTDRGVPPILASVRITPTHVMATDRYTAARHTYGDGSAEPVSATIRIADAKELAKAGDPVAIARDDSGIVKFSYMDGVTRAYVEVSGEYPPLDKPFSLTEDDPAPMTTLALRPSHLARLAKVRPLSRSGRDAPARFTFYGAKKMVHVRVGDAFDALIVTSPT